MNRAEFSPCEIMAVYHHPSGAFITYEALSNMSWFDPSVCAEFLDALVASAKDAERDRCECGAVMVRIAGGSDPTADAAINEKTPPPG